jgi:hypothetical protein
MVVEIKSGKEIAKQLDKADEDASYTSNLYEYKKLHAQKWVLLESLKKELQGKIDDLREGKTIMAWHEVATAILAFKEALSLLEEKVETNGLEKKRK